MRIRAHGRALAVALLAVLLAATGCTASAASDTPAAGPIPRPAPVAALPGVPAPSLLRVHQVAGDTCADYTFPVVLRGATLPSYLLWGRLCGPDSSVWHAPSTALEVLLHGAGYAASYWQWPYQPQRYSYVHAAADRGDATLALDLLGVGGSSHPDGDALTYNLQAWAVHDVVLLVRQGALGATWRHVYLIGHDTGASVAWQEAGQYRDVDALVLADGAHTVYPPARGQLSADRVSAANDPRYAHMRWAGDDYLAPARTTRCADLYWRPGVDPGVCRTDERINRTTAIPAGMASGLSGVFASLAPAHVDVPVLVTLGAHDALLCGADGNCADGSNPNAHECRYYSSAPACRVEVVDGEGHMMLHRTAPTSFRIILTWLAQR